jgi:predicted AlkP superfamily phosphohydrolase/phosphomutase
VKTQKGEGQVSQVPVIFIGLDAFDPDLARQWARAGRLPTLARLLERGTQAGVRNPFGLFVGALWVSFASAMRPDRHGFHCNDEIDLGSYRWKLRPPTPEAYRAFWNRIGDSGRRVVAIDVPHARAAPSTNGVELFEWGCHDRHFGLHSYPPQRARELAARFGFHPGLGAHPWQARDFAADDFVSRQGRFRTRDEDGIFVRSMTEGAEAKGRLIEAMLREERPDLLVAVFGESHAVGHQQWHLHDEGHPRFDAAVRDAIGGDPLLQVYRSIDAALGRIVAAAPPGTCVIVNLSHGMAAHYDGTHLLDEILLRIEHADTGSASVRWAAGLREAVKPVMPAMRQLADRCRIPLSVRTGLAQVARGDGSRMRARRRFFACPNNTVYGGIRLNLAGREPHGRVRPEEADRLLRSLQRDLLDLVNAETGEHAVQAVHLTDRHHRRARTDAMPDLLVDWQRDVPIETVRSPKIGTIHTPYTHWRTGDHRPDGLLIAVGAGLDAGARTDDIDVEDIGPSIAARLGVPLAQVDGKPIAWLADPAPAKARHIIEPEPLAVQMGCV